MTDGINFFQSIFLFKYFAPSSANKQEIRLSIWLKREANNLARVADEEMRNAETAKNLALTANDSEKVQVFIEIAVWHHTRAIGKYQKSAARFSEAGAIKTCKQNKFKKSAIEMSQRAAQAEVVLNQLINFQKN